MQAARLAEADAWLRRYERFWNEKLDALESLLLAEDEAKSKEDQGVERWTQSHNPDAYGTLIEPTTLKIQRLLPGPIERMWAYLTDSELRRKWLAAGAMEMKVGAPFELVWRNGELNDPPGKRPEGFSEEHRMQSRITEFEPLRKLTIAWNGSGDVTFELEPKGKGVLLTVIHRRLPIARPCSRSAPAGTCISMFWSPAPTARSRQRSGKAGAGCTRNTNSGCRPVACFRLPPQAGSRCWYSLCSRVRLPRTRRLLAVGAGDQNIEMHVPAGADLEHGRAIGQTAMDHGEQHPCPWAPART